MAIWAHTLVKNEEKWLWYSVSSIAPYVDKILLWDTGSTDASLEIEKELVKKFSEKIEMKERKIASAEEFALVRQEMLDATLSDWFIVLDGDEIWYEESIKKVIETIHKEGNNIESIVVPTINLIGDVYHRQPESAGRYKFRSRIGHYNLRAIKRSIPGLHSQGIHGVWGWADEEGKMIQERVEEKVIFIDAPYIHTTFLQRGGEGKDKNVVKRGKKLKYEIGDNVPLDFYYPESFFEEKPEFVKEPWSVMTKGFQVRAAFETPLRKLKRRIWWGRAGY